MNVPHGFRSTWLPYWFACPSCAYRSPFPYSSGIFHSNQKSIVVLFWCASCGRFCKLKNQWRMPTISLVVGLVSFVLLYWLLIGGLTRMSIIWALFWIACVAIVVEAILFFIGRFTNKYVVANHAEP